MAVYTAVAPGNNQILSISKALLQGNTTYVKEMLEKDHNFTLTSGAGPADGYHNIIHLNPQATPAMIGGYGQLYSKTIDGHQELMYERDDGQETQLTNNCSIATNIGWYKFPGMIIKWGIVTATAQPSETFVFPVAATIPVFTNCVHVQITQWEAAGVPVVITDHNIIVTAKTALDFTIYNTKQTGGTWGQYQYLAIGN